MKIVIVLFALLSASASFAQGKIYSVSIPGYGRQVDGPSSSFQSACQNNEDARINRARVDEALKRAGSSLTSAVLTVVANDRVDENTFFSDVATTHVYWETCSGTLVSNDPSVSFVTSSQEFDHEKNFETCQNAYQTAVLDPSVVEVTKNTGTKFPFLNYCRVDTIKLVVD